MDKEVYEKLIEQYEENSDGRSLPEFLADKEKEAQNISESVFSIEDRRSKEVIRHQEAMKMLNTELFEVRNKCPHFSTTYYPDPSGNNDSSVVCDYCGREGRRVSSLFKT